MEIDYGRLDALEAILGGRAVIQDAFLRGKSYGSPDSVVLVNAPNTFTADTDSHTPVTIQAHSNNQTAPLLVGQDADASPRFQVRSSGAGATIVDLIPRPGSINMSSVVLHGHLDSNASGTIKPVWLMGVDEASSLDKYRDWALGRLDAAGTCLDSLYANHNGDANDPTFSFGDAPAKPSYKLTVRGTLVNTTAGTIPGRGTGTLRLVAESNQSGYILGLQSANDPLGFERIFVDSYTSAGAWNLVLRPQASINQPALTLRDRVSGTIAQKTITLGGTPAAFTLGLPAELGGGTTASIAADATPEKVQWAINSTAGIVGQQTYVTGPAGGPYVVNFVRPVGPVGTMSITGGGAGAAVANTTVGVAETETFQIRSDGALVWSADSTARLARAATGILSVTNHFAVAGRIGVGTGATAPAAMVDIEGGASTATFQLGTTAGGLLAIRSLTSATSQIFTNNNSDLTLGTNGTTARFTINKGGGFTVAEGNHFAFGTTTGTQLGTASSQKIGLYGATPIVQPNAVGAATGYAAGSTVATFHSDDTYTGNTGSTAYTLNGIVAALKRLGLIAS